ncbi:hypothetical protein D1002_01020 [Riemerella anatipestifer]|nr:hypothetical protein [Riemerella anatipestifer]
MYLLASCYTTEKSSEKEKTLALKTICKYLDIPLKKVHGKRLHLTVEGSKWHQLLKLNALQNFCAYNEITLQSFPLNTSADDFWEFLKPQS